jgi:hypothetical protein
MAGSLVTQIGMCTVHGCLFLNAYHYILPLVTNGADTLVSTHSSLDAEYYPKLFYTSELKSHFTRNAMMLETKSRTTQPGSTPLRSTKHETCTLEATIPNITPSQPKPTPSGQLLLDEEGPQVRQLPRARHAQHRQLNQRPPHHPRVRRLRLVPKLRLALLKTPSVTRFLGKEPRNHLPFGRPAPA